MCNNTSYTFSNFSKSNPIQFNNFIISIKHGYTHTEPTIYKIPPYVCLECVVEQQINRPESIHRVHQSIHHHDHHHNNNDLILFFYIFTEIKPHFFYLSDSVSPIIL